MRARAGSAALAVVLLAGCQASADTPQPPPIPSSTAPGLPLLRPVRHLPRAPSVDYLVPLALVVHATRATSDVAVADARRIITSGDPLVSHRAIRRRDASTQHRGSPR